MKKSKEYKLPIDDIKKVIEEQEKYWTDNKSIEDLLDDPFVKAMGDRKYIPAPLYSMEESSKYFTPSIEDIHVGYEYEWNKGCGKCEWKSSVILAGELGYNKLTWTTHCRIFSLKEMLNYEYIRVPYLTKEQIEKEGWKLESDSMLDINNNPVWPYSSPNLGMLYVPSTKFLGLYDKKRKIYVYQAECKDINTFRKICKLVGV